jgi:hypothetical protein
MKKVDFSVYQKFTPFFSNISKNSTVIGIHVRIHTPNSVFSYSMKESRAILFKNLDRILQTRKNVYFSFATDNEQLFQNVLDRYGERVIYTKSVRLPDFDHESALADFLFLHFSDEFIGTFVSTFSNLIYARTAVVPLILEKDAPEFLKLFHSEAGPLIGIYQKEQMSLPFVQWNVKVSSQTQIRTLAEFYKHHIL